MSKRWCLKHESRVFIVHQETREAAIEIFTKEIGEVFRLLSLPTAEDIEAGVYELGPDDMTDGRVIVDRNPARETRQAHVEPAAVAEPSSNGVNNLISGNSVSVLERMKNRAIGDS